MDKDGVLYQDGFSYKDDIYIIKHCTVSMQDGHNISVIETTDEPSILQSIISMDQVPMVPSECPSYFMPTNVDVYGDCMVDIYKKCDDGHYRNKERRRWPGKK